LKKIFFPNKKNRDFTFFFYCSEEIIQKFFFEEKTNKTILFILTKFFLKEPLWKLN
jgi:hypothetical protein